MIDPGERLGRLVNLRDLAVARSQAPSAQKLPVNTLRNNTTGAEYSFDSAPSVAVAQGPELDYSQPIEIFGQGRGYAIKGQPLSALINGRRVDFGVDIASTVRARDLAMKRAEQLLGLESGALDIGKKRLELGALQSTGGAKPLTMKRAEQLLGLESGALDIGKKRLELGALQSKGGAKPLTESQGKAAGFGVRTEDADAIIRSVGAGGDVQPGLIKRAAESVPFVGNALGTMANVTQSEDQQKVEQAQRNFINAILRRESGAVISPEEFDNARKQYFPQPGDHPGTIAQKLENRQAVIASLITESGNGYAQAKAEFDARKAAISGQGNGDVSGASVTMPDGQVITFPSRAHADGFRKAAGL